MNLDEMLGELKQEYLESIPNKIIEIKNHLNEENYELLRNDFHKIKGTGKTYGLPEISELGAVMEVLCIEKPSELKDHILISLELLKEIHSSRIASQEFSLNKDARFITMQSFLKI